MKVYEVLERAADLIQRDGWAQFTQLDKDGRMCAFGAIYAAQDEPLPTFVPSEAAEIANRAIGGTSINGPGCLLGGWNNAPERTKEEVVALFRACAITERARIADAMLMARTKATKEETT